MAFLRTLAAGVLLAASLALAACSGEEREAEPAPPANPLIYEIASSDGAARGWLFGTIHALPEGTRWRTAPIGRALEEAELLLVEIAGLEDRGAIERTFARLATSTGLPPLPQRIAPSLRPDLAALMDEAGIGGRDSARIETWAAALMLARTQSGGSAAHGVDRAVIAAFEGREVRELEGAAAQLAVFDTLSEADQRDLLREVVAGAGEADDTGEGVIGADPARLREAWLAGDEAALVEASETGILADPGLREALLVARNRAWLDPVLAALESDARPLVAVGAAHVVGPEGLAALLEERGYRVTPLR
ncbi:TraB/GumN family protein [Erythrobacter sp. HL-111]|uniref:TraB/GumN family protein n=1 Tax=Erythrobacter sp. HL-111 TaxID=1798193 RepID=UPI000B7FC759|nr:TraB/GumN family protein [Erythrobacter sp. HL-111]